MQPPQIKLESPKDLPSVFINRTWKGPLYCLDGTDILGIRSPQAKIPLFPVLPDAEYLEQGLQALKSAAEMPTFGYDDDVTPIRVYEIVIKCPQGKWYGWVAIPEGEDPEIEWDDEIQAQFGTVV